MGINFGFPTQTLHVFDELKKKKRNAKSFQ